MRMVSTGAGKCELILIPDYGSRNPRISLCSGMYKRPVHLDTQYIVAK